MTYNIHGCVGADRVVNPGKIAAIIADLDVDIVALQEVDAGHPTREYRNQAQMIAGRFAGYGVMTVALIWALRPKALRRSCLSARCATPTAPAWCCGIARAAARTTGGRGL